MRGRPMRSPSPPSRSPARASNSANYRSTNGRERRTEDARGRHLVARGSLSFRPLARSSTERALLALYFSLYAAGARTRHSPFSQRERWLYTLMDPFAIPTKLFHLFFLQNKMGASHDQRRRKFELVLSSKCTSTSTIFARNIPDAVGNKSLATSPKIGPHFLHATSSAEQFSRSEGGSPITGHDRGKNEPFGGPRL